MGANARKYTALITTTNACQYLRLGIRAVAGTNISWKFVSVGVTKLPQGITQAQCAAVSTLGTTHNGVTIFRLNTLIKKFNEFKYFSVTELYGNWNGGDFHSFRGCSNLEEIEFPDTLTNIRDGAFYGCSKLKHIDFKNVTNLGRQSFSETQLQEAVFNEGFKTIQMTGSTSYGAFQNVSTLKYVDLPSTTTGIGGRNFYSSAPVLVCRATTPPSLQTYNTGLKAIYVPAASVDTYKAATNWSAQASKIRQIEGTWYETHRELEPS